MAIRDDHTRKPYLCRFTSTNVRSATNEPKRYKNSLTPRLRSAPIAAVISSASSLRQLSHLRVGVGTPTATAIQNRSPQKASHPHLPTPPARRPLPLPPPPPRQQPPPPRLLLPISRAFKENGTMREFLRSRIRLSPCSIYSVEEEPSSLPYEPLTAQSQLPVCGW